MTALITVPYCATHYHDKEEKSDIAPYVIPYTLKGKKKIENWGEALKAAKNLSDEVS